MKVKIAENRKVYMNSHYLGVDKENKVESLEIDYPDKYVDFEKAIEMQDGDWTKADPIINDRYLIENNVTTHANIMAQIVFKNMRTNEVFKSKMFPIRFEKAINATEEIEEESKDLIIELVDAKFDTVMDELDNRYVAQEEGKGLSANDFTDELKADVIANTNARHIHNNKDVLDNISQQDIDKWNNSSFSGDYNDLKNKPVIPTKLEDLEEDNTHRTVTDTEKTSWSSKSDFSGNYDDLSNKPIIPEEVTESTVSGWGFTKNTGNYNKPATGIPSTDLAENVQISLGKADTAIQQHQDISGKEDKSNKTTTINAQSTDKQYPSAKAVYDALVQTIGNINTLLGGI